MNSTSEASYGARVGNAENLLASLNNFANYQALKPEFSTNNLRSLINTTKGFNNIVAEKKQNYALALENRIQVVTKGPASVEKTLAPINGTVKAIFGKNSKEAREVAGIIAKYRGNNIPRNRATTPTQESVSTSYQSYNSKLQFFADLIVNLTQFGNSYQPTNEPLKPNELHDLYERAVIANNEVTSTFTGFSQHNATRLDSYKELSRIATGIKESIKAQYGPRSTEYRLIKGLKI